MAVGGECLCSTGTISSLSRRPFRYRALALCNYTVEFSADSHVEAGRKEWISLNDLAKKRDGVIVVSPQWVREGPTIAEVCVSKVGAEITQDRFRSGTFAELTARLQDIPADVVYLLPLFLPGVMDMQTGEDVRKGSLGSV